MNMVPFLMQVTSVGTKELGAQEHTKQWTWTGLRTMCMLKDTSCIISFLVHLAKNLEKRLDRVLMCS